MPEPEEKEPQDTHSALEEAWDKAEEAAKEPEETVEAEATPEEPEEKPAEEVEAEATPTPGGHSPRKRLKRSKKRAGTAGRSHPLGGRASGDVPGSGPQGSVVP